MSSAQDLKGPKKLIESFQDNEKYTQKARMLVNKLKNDDMFQNAKKFREQCHILYHYFREGEDKPISYDVLARVFEEKVTRSSIFQQVEKLHKQPKSNGRPPGLTEPECQEIDDWIRI